MSLTPYSIPFTSYEFNKFCEINGIKHLTYTPFHPSSHGAAENVVKSLSKVLKKFSKVIKVFFQIQLSVSTYFFIKIVKTVQLDTLHVMTSKYDVEKTCKN